MKPGAFVINNRGVALTMAIIMIICSTILAGYALQAGWNQRKLAIAYGSKRDKIYFKAKAGIVEARWRIRNNYLAATAHSPALVNLGGGASFADAAYDPDIYDLNIDGGAVDARVNIGALVSGMRQIDSTGLDN